MAVPAHDAGIFDPVSAPAAADLSIRRAAPGRRATQSHAV